MTRTLAWNALLVGLLIVSKPLAAQSAPAAITITGTPRPATVTAATLATLPRATVSQTSNGITTTYTGVWLSDLLAHAGVPSGPGMRGAALSTVLVASASDGYRVAFSLGEVDPAITAGRYLVADTADGKPLFGESGNFRLVIPDDKRGARSVRLLSSITLVSLPAPNP